MNLPAAQERARQTTMESRQSDGRDAPGQARVRNDARSDARSDQGAPLGFALGAAARRLAKFYTSALSGGPVTPSQLFFLRQVWREDGLALVTLRERAHLDATSATWLADQLEKAGLIERRRNDPDRRVVRIWLTPEGQALRTELLPRITQWEQGLQETLLQHHTAEQLAAFEAVLATLTSVLPDGDDLWAALAERWDARLDALRQMVEQEQAEADAATRADD
jgi:DNA-binding MarR family transcriptional regulator